MKKNLQAVFCAKSVAIIGASKKLGSVGNEILKNIVNNKFSGSIYPINLNETEIMGLKCYPSILDVKADVDLAVIIVPAKIVPNVIDECGKMKVKSAIIISAGFKEVGKEGAALENLVLEKAEKYGITLIGPNCLGAINTNPLTSLNTTFAPLPPIRGNIGFASQSGALCSGIINLLPTLNVGLSQMVSLGNQADITANDLLSYWQDEKDVKQALFYLESIKNPSQFKKEAEALTAKKPVIVVKSGRSNEGAKAAASHTGSLAGTDRVQQALFDTCGVIRETGLRNIFNTAFVFDKCPIPKGNKVAIVTNAGGPGVLATDEIIESGLKLSELSEKTKAELKAKLMPQASVHNPVDVIASASVENYEDAIEAVLKDKNVDMLLVIYLYITGRNDITILQQLNKFKEKYPNKPIVGVFITEEDFNERVKSEIKENSIAHFSYVEEGVLGLKRLYERSVYLNNLKIKAPVIEANKQIAEKIIEKAEKRFKQESASNKTLTTFESLEIFKSYGLPLPKYSLIKTEKDLLTQADKIGFPAVLKISSYNLSHKTEVGGVIVNILDKNQLVEEYRGLIERIRKVDTDSGLEGIILMQQIKGSREFVAGISSYEDLHMLMFGLGGIFIETLNEVEFTILPLNTNGCEKLVSGKKIGKLLGSVRGNQPIDTDKLKRILFTLDRFVSDFKQIAELDLNPIMADKQGNLSVVDARIALK